jgi:hypothetical protein
MCTINSLNRIWHLFCFSTSLRTVLVYSLIFLNQAGSGALKANYSLAGINVNAPPDITINIKRTSGCDTLINIPPATYSGQCNGPLKFTTYSVFNTLSTNGGIMYFTTGVFKVYFTVADACRNMGIDSMTVTVFDAVGPNVICNPEMTMNLPSYGFLDSPAWIFDAGSWDSCGHVYFKIKRMFSPSGYSCFVPGNPNNAFDDQVRFCCEDVDSSFITVILRVYDIYPGAGPVSDSLLNGRFVDCMVRAYVKDKIAPDIDCPANVTVNCGTDLDSLLASNPNPVVSDNCSIPTVQTIISRNLNACGAGTINRTFIATDKHGQVSSCTQVITVLKVNTFNGLDPVQLKWPSHKIVYACRIDSDTINAGIPEITEDGCANVLTSHHDEKYNFDRGGVCAKILRYWEVIDWCKYNPGLLPNPKVSNNGYYHFTQEIKIMDTVAPILFGLQDTVIGIQTSACQPGVVILPAVSATDCGSSDHISLHYEVDFDSNGSIDVTGSGGNASGTYPIGRHHLKFYANDSCHNTGTLDIVLEVIDSKPPNANAIFGLASSLIQMQAGAMVSIQAKLFDEKSSDNCTAREDLRFSFSSDINDTIRIYNCDSIGLRIIHLFVWDLNGNSSEVTTFITIQDVNNLCPSGLKIAQVSGRIRTINDQAVKGVDVNLNYDQTDNHSTTDQDGNFSFNAIPRNKKIKLTPSCNKNFIDGITTADIIKMQRHILGVELIQSPLDLLAADVDFSKKISTKDIVWLRKLILGQITEIPNQDSYVFIDKHYVFNNPQDPFDELDSCKNVVMETSNPVNSIDILGIKMGDLNHSYKANGFAPTGLNQFNLTYKISDGKIEIYPATSGWIDGFQFELSNKDLCLEQWDDVNSNLENWSDGNYHITGNNIRVSYSLSHSFSIDQTAPILSIPVHIKRENCEPVILLNSDFHNEAYGVDQLYAIKFITKKNLSAQEDMITIYPNPFSEQLNIVMDLKADSNIQLDVFSPDSRHILSDTYQFQKGTNTILLKKNSFSAKGMYILQIKGNQTSKIFKIINE